jgi:flagellar P-ring protein precursor FlgI
MKKCMTILLVLLLTCAAAHAERLKDVVHIEGAIDNDLKGVGLVIGLKGTGDGKGLASSALKYAVQKILKDNNLPERDMQSKNVALVMVTATLPAFSKIGAKIDVKVSSIGSATSLQGGTLLETHLIPVGSIDTVYAVAQGPLIVGDDQTHATAAEIPGGGKVVEEEPCQVVQQKDGKRFVTLLLNYADYTTANNIVEAIRSDVQLFGKYGNIAHAANAGQVDVIVPEGLDEVSFMSKLLDVTVEVDNSAKVVLNPRNKTVIIGERVTVLPVAISHGGLRITVGKDTQGVATLDPGQSKGMPLQKLVDMLNAIKATPDDIIAIIQALKAAGVLQGEIIMQ